MIGQRWLLLSEAKADVAAYQETFPQCELQPVVKPSLWGSAGNPRVCVNESRAGWSPGQPWEDVPHSEIKLRGE